MFLLEMVVRDFFIDIFLLIGLIWKNFRVEEVLVVENWIILWGFCR